MEMPLAMMEPGKTVVIRKVTGRDEIRQRLAELGFVVNGVVTVVSRLGGEPDPAGEGEQGSPGPGADHEDHGGMYRGVRGIWQEAQDMTL